MHTGRDGEESGPLEVNSLWGSFVDLRYNNYQQLLMLQMVSLTLQVGMQTLQQSSYRQTHAGLEIEILLPKLPKQQEYMNGHHVQLKALTFMGKRLKKCQTVCLVNCPDLYSSLATTSCVCAYMYCGEFSLCVRWRYTHKGYTPDHTGPRTQTAGSGVRRQVFTESAW